MKQKFSNIIECIKHEESNKKALDILKKGFSVTINNEKISARLAQTIARFLSYENDFEEAKKWGGKAIDLWNRFYFHDTMGQIYKKELHTISNQKEIDSQEKFKYAIEVARAAVNYFRKAQEMLEQDFQLVNHESDTEIEHHIFYLDQNLRFTSSYYGEVDVNLKLTALLLGISENKERKKSISNFLQGGKNIFAIEDMFKERIGKWEEFSDFLGEIEERTDKSMVKIVSFLDSSAWKKDSDFNHIDQLSKLVKKREEFFFGTKYHQDVIAKCSPNIRKMNLEGALKINYVKSFIKCSRLEDEELAKFKNFVEDLRNLCENDELSNDGKICYMSVVLAEYYVKKVEHQEIVFKDFQHFSFELAKLDLPFPEPYFFYMISHWPNEEKDDPSNTKYLSTYDEELLVRSVKKLREIQSSRTNQKNPKKGKPDHRPLFFLARGKRFNRLEIVEKGGIGMNYEFTSKNLIKIVGNESVHNQKEIVTKLPGGKEVILRSHSHFSVRNIDEVSFDLGKSITISYISTIL